MIQTEIRRDRIEKGSTPDPLSSRSMIIKEIRCRSILNRSGIPNIDYAVNPYIGCSHKCQYCYAVFMKKYTGHAEPWGDFVDVKINGPGVMEKQIQRLRTRSRILFGSACDAYQDIEVKYKITQQCLEKLRYSEHDVSILTKSSLVLRDLDILKQIHRIEVGFSIPTMNRRVQRIFEPRAASLEKRLQAIKILHENSIRTWIFVAPIIPHFSDTEPALNHIFHAGQAAGADYIMFDTLNPYPRVWDNVKRLMKKHFPEALRDLLFFYNNQRAYKARLAEKITRLSGRYRIKFRLPYNRTC